MNPPPRAATARKKLGILLSTPPEHPNLTTLFHLAQAALARRMRIYLYLVDDGILALNTPEIATLKKDGVNLFLCAYGADRRGIAVSNKGAFSGLVVLSDLMKGCDRFVAFN